MKTNTNEEANCDNSERGPIVENLEGMAGLHATLKNVVRKIVASTALECIAANVRGGGVTTYIVTISPAKSGDVFVCMDCEVTPVRRTLYVVKGLENGRAPKPRRTQDAGNEAKPEILD